VIDADYTGNIGVILRNYGLVTFHVTPKMRIAQLILTKIYSNIKIKEVQQLPQTQRGDKVSGSSGTHDLL